MKKILAFFLLLSHMNTSMFLPQVAEEDQFDANGHQLDDMNSVVEYITVALGYDHVADDEDDDSGQNFHLIKAFDYNFEQQYCLLENTSPEKTDSEFSRYITASIQLVSFDVVTPPPEA